MERHYFEKASKDEKLIVLIYDISNNKRRYKLVKLLEGYGRRVQESAFECCLTAKKLATLKQRITRIITVEDSVRIYPIHSVSDVITWNGEPCFEQSDVFIC